MDLQFVEEDLVRAEQSQQLDPLEQTQWNVSVKKIQALQTICHLNYHAYLFFFKYNGDEKKMTDS